MGKSDWYITNDLVEKSHAVNGLLFRIEFMKIWYSGKHYSNFPSPLPIQFLKTPMVNSNYENTMKDFVQNILLYNKTPVIGIIYYFHNFLIVLYCKRLL